MWKDLICWKYWTSSLKSTLFRDENIMQPIQQPLFNDNNFTDFLWINTLSLLISANCRTLPFLKFQLSLKAAYWENTLSICHPDRQQLNHLVLTLMLNCDKQLTQVLLREKVKWTFVVYNTCSKIYICFNSSFQCFYIEILIK